MEHHAKPA